MRFLLGRCISVGIVCFNGLINVLKKSTQLLDVKLTRDGLESDALNMMWIHQRIRSGNGLMYRCINYLDNCIMMCQLLVYCVQCFRLDHPSQSDCGYQAGGEW